MKNIAGFFLFFAFILSWTSCEKPPAYNDTPYIEWAEFSQDTIQQLSDAVAFRFNFTDGDGDLGKDNDTQDHILIIDTRRTPNDTAFYKIPTIPQQGTISGISGQIEVTMSQICCIHPTNPLILCQPINNYFDPVVYKIKIRDNAGRWSNEILSDTLFVKCF